MAKMGRPSLYGPEVTLEICRLIAEGEALRSICKRDGMPVRSAVHQWLLEHAEFAKQYETAQSLRADSLFDECLEIADDSSRDTVTKTRADGTTYEGFDFDHIARSRLRVDTRKWVCARMVPKKYGDRVLNEITGKDGGPIDHRDVSSLSDLELEAIAAGKVA